MFSLILLRIKYKRLRLRASDFRLASLRILWLATTKKRYSDTTIQRYTEPEPELEPCINYANYCLQSPRETSVIIFSGGRADIPKNISYKAPLHQMIACPYLID